MERLLAVAELQNHASSTMMRLLAVAEPRTPPSSTVLEMRPTLVSRCRLCSFPHVRTRGLQAHRLAWKDNI